MPASGRSPPRFARSGLAVHLVPAGLPPPAQPDLESACHSIGCSHCKIRSFRLAGHRIPAGLPPPASGSEISTSPASGAAYTGISRSFGVGWAPCSGGTYHHQRKPESGEIQHACAQHQGATYDGSFVRNAPQRQHTPPDARRTPSPVLQDDGGVVGSGTALTDHTRGCSRCRQRPASPRCRAGLRQPATAPPRSGSRMSKGSAKTRAGRTPRTAPPPAGYGGDLVPSSDPAPAGE